MKTNLVETAVGAVVIVIAAAFFTFAYTTSGIGKGSGGYQLTAEFDNADGIGIGSDVRMSGVKIGTVTSQELDPVTYQAVLRMSIDPTLKLPDDSSAKVTSEGLLGSKFVALEPGGSADMLQRRRPHRLHPGRHRHLVAGQPVHVRQQQRRRRSNRQRWHRE
jgi:phospholipid/cholesterol/gamma-HCH transport system substrate-binding protein